MNTMTRSEMRTRLAEISADEHRTLAAQLDADSDVYINIATQTCGCSPTGQTYLAGAPEANHINGKMPRASELAQILEHEYFAIWCYEHNHFTVLLKTEWLRTQIAMNKIPIIWLDTINQPDKKEIALGIYLLKRMNPSHLSVEFFECECWPPATEAPSIYDEAANRAYIEEARNRVPEMELALS